MRDLHRSQYPWVRVAHRHERKIVALFGQWADRKNFQEGTRELRVALLGNFVGLLLVFAFLGELLSARPGASVNFLGMWATFAILIGLLFVAAVAIAAHQKSLKLGLVLVAHLVIYVLAFDRLVVYLAQVKDLHDT